MLKGISPPLNADVLQPLCAMGLGDDLVIVDTNFPADSVVRETRLAGVADRKGVIPPDAG